MWLWMQHFLHVIAELQPWSVQYIAWGAWFTQYIALVHGFIVIFCVSINNACNSVFLYYGLDVGS